MSEKELVEAELALKEFVSTHNQNELGDGYNVNNRTLYLELENLFHKWMHLFLKLLDIDVYTFETPLLLKGDAGKHSYSDTTYYINKKGTKMGSNYGDDKVIEMAYGLFVQSNTVTSKDINLQIIELKSLIEKVNKSIANLTKLSPVFALDSL